MSRSSNSHRFLIITFTNAAAEEVKDRQANDSEFECLKDRMTVTTLNALGWRRIRSQVNNARLLQSPTDRHFAVLNQLRPVWIDRSHIAQAVSKRGRNARTLLDVMDNLKSMGFDHTADTSFERFKGRIKSLILQGASWRIEEQFDSLTRMGILESHTQNNIEHASHSAKAFYDMFFTFWRDASASLLDQSTFTFEDQKYWSYLDLRSPGPDGKAKPFIYGAARYDHILVDEFQDINPLDLALIKVIVERNQSTLTIVGDDDQAIFEWRGASPEYILQPQRHFGSPFEDYLLETNYRSPRNIVTHSQNLIAHNKNRVEKRVSAVEDATDAEISVVPLDRISDRLRYVTQIVRAAEPGKVAVIGRRRSHLIPYEIYFASGGAPFKTAADLDIFETKALNGFTNLLEVWMESGSSRASRGKAVNDALLICNLIKKFQLNRKDSPNLKSHIQRARPRTTMDAVQAIASYSGAPLSGKSHTDLYEVADAFLSADSLSEAIKVIEGEFAGLSFDKDKGEEDIWYTAPPLLQLAEIAEDEGFEAVDLIDRIENAKEQLEEYRNLEDVAHEGATSRVWERPLHLLTAFRAKGKEYDTVVLLDTVNGIWPDYRANDERLLEAERRLFYVAFTRAQRRVIMLTRTDAPISPFIGELELPGR